MRSFHHLWIALGLLSVLWIDGGCVQMKEFNNAAVDPVWDTIGGPAVKVIKVTDMRQFEADPRDIKTPTLVDSRKINDRSVTLRAIGKGSPGMGTFYYIYPEGQRTVETVVQTAVENALRTKGYSVVAQASPTAASATPVEVKIKKFWLVVEPNGVVPVIRAHYDVEIEVTSSMTLNGGTESGAAYRNASAYVGGLVPQYVADRMCEGCVSGGLNDLAADLQSKLKEPK